MTNPEIGKAKSGDLQGVRVYKYKLGNNQILPAYEIIDSTLYLYTFGSHRNFYRKLEKYIHPQGKQVEISGRKADYVHKT